MNEAVSSGKPLIGQMRFQWWKEAIKDCYDVRPSIVCCLGNKLSSRLCRADPHLILS